MQVCVWLCEHAMFCVENKKTCKLITMCLNWGGRDRQRDRQTDRQTDIDRQTDRPTDRDRQAEAETELELENFILQGL